jgi:L-rhamnose mutarotase
MKKVIVRYKVKPEMAEENKKLIQAVFAELKKNKPAGLCYSSYMLEDGVSFVHLAQIEAEVNPLSKSEAFQAFQKNIKDRCVEPPFAQNITDIGYYEG